MRRLKSYVDEKARQDFLAVFPPPRRPISELTPPQQDDDIFVMSIDDFVITLKKTFNGSAGGPTGSMGEHFRDILHHTAVPMALLRLFTLTLQLLITDPLAKSTIPQLVNLKKVNIKANRSGGVQNVP